MRLLPGLTLVEQQLKQAGGLQNDVLFEPCFPLRLQLGRLLNIKIYIFKHLYNLISPYISLLNISWEAI